MICMSLNIRGVGGTLKAASFRRSLDLTRPDIVFLQETLVNEHKARAFMLKFRPTWVSCAVSSVGSSGGLLVAWDPSLFNLCPFLTCGGILLSGLNKATKRIINLLNVYGPCTERKEFWIKLANSGLLLLRNLVIAGDLNFTLSSGEIWGGSATSGSLAGFFNLLLQDHKLLDIKPDTIVPTWRNGRVGLEAIAKRLDRFLISEELLLEVKLHRTWVEYPFVSDHAPILLRLEDTIMYRPYPFKFHAQWLLEKDFNVLVKKFVD
jgi:hypothetical protein